MFAVYLRKLAPPSHDWGPFVGRGRMTRDDLENDEVFSAAVNGLPKVVELITAAPEEKRSLALAAAHQAYLRTAQELGYDESDAQQ